MKLFKTKEGKVFAGVCAGLARAIGMDVTWMRIIWVAVALLTVTVIPVLVAYIVLALVLPDDEDGTQVIPVKRGGYVAFAAFLIAMGLFTIINALVPINLTRFMFPIFLIGVGVLIVVWAMKKKK